VAGAAALLLERRPQWTPEQVADRLRSTAAPLTRSPGGMGSGRLNVAAAIDCGQTAVGGVLAVPDDGTSVQGKDKKKKRDKHKNKNKKRKNRR
jgi:hypothetical protein